MNSSSSMQNIGLRGFKKWLLLSFAVKGLLFIFFAYQFQQNSFENLQGILFNSSGDTPRYINPIEDFVDRGTYTSVCRMPGMLPIYGPLYGIFGPDLGKTLYILFQFVVSCFSVVFMAQIAQFIFKQEKVFVFTFWLFALSSFASIFDHFGNSDSFSNSFMIFGFYFLLKGLSKSERINQFIFVGGCFLAWSIFMRPINGLVLLPAGLFILYEFKFTAQFISKSTLFLLPVFLSIGIWTWVNYTKTDRFIPLQDNISICYPQLDEGMMEIRKLIVAWGEDIQPWTTGSAGEWFFSHKGSKHKPFPYADGVYASTFNQDSLISLRKKWHTWILMEHSSQREDLQKEIIQTAKLYHETYTAENQIKVLTISKLKLLTGALFPKRYHHLPFPARSEMNLIQFVMKAGYLVLFWLVSFMGIVGMINSYRKRDSKQAILSLIVVGFLVVLTIGMGLIEQRYFVPVYIFFIPFVASIFADTLDKAQQIWHSREETSHIDS